MSKNKNNNAASSNPRTTTARGQRAPKGVLRRLIRTLFEFYPVLLPVTLVCIHVLTCFMPLSRRTVSPGTVKRQHPFP